MKKFKAEFVIPFYESNKYGEVKPISIIRYLGETSELHSEDQNIGMDEMRRNNWAWILYKWKVRMEYYPKVKDKIIVETWASNFYKFYAYREFVIYDVNMEEIGRARSLWIFLDTKRKRPVRIPEKFGEIYNLIDEKVFDDFQDLKEVLEIEDTIDLYIRKLDIDYNNHVNNSNYLEWILETIPVNFEEGYFLNEFEIIYKQESIYGETVLSHRDEGTYSEDKVVFNHKIVNKESGEIRTLARTIWNKI